MPELRKDPIVGRWVIIATERAQRPSRFRARGRRRRTPALCPFCPGHEDKTPPEVYAYRPAALRRRRTRRAGACASCRTGSPRSRSRATSTAQARASTTG